MGIGSVTYVRNAIIKNIARTILAIPAGIACSGHVITGSSDATRRHGNEPFLVRVFVVAPFSWLYYKNIYNPIKRIWHRCLPEPLKERIRSMLGWRTWADHERTQEELRQRYEA